MEISEKVGDLAASSSLVLFHVHYHCLRTCLCNYESSVYRICQCALDMYYVSVQEGGLMTIPGFLKTISIVYSEDYNGLTLGRGIDR